MNVSTADADDYGVYSVVWMIKQAARWVPRRRLELGFEAGINYVEALAREGQAMNPSDVLDVMGQLILTGQYVPTAFRDLDEDDGVVEADTLTEQEIADFVAGLSTDPEAEDPMDGYKL